MNPGPVENEAGMLTTRSRRSVCNIPTFWKSLCSTGLTEIERNDCTENVVLVYVIKLHGLIKQRRKLNKRRKFIPALKVNFPFFLPSFLFDLPSCRPIPLLVSNRTVIPHERCNLHFARVFIASCIISSALSEFSFPMRKSIYFIYITQYTINVMQICPCA